MEKERLIERLKYVMCKKDVIALAKLFSEMNDGVSILFKLCQSKDEKLSFHSAWVLENVLSSNIGLFSISIPFIVDQLPRIKNPSTRRHFSKLLNMAMIACEKNLFPKDACRLFMKLDMEPVIETCFEWLLDVDTKPAIKAHCMDILVYLSEKHEWIKDELPHVIELQMIDGTPGIIAKGSMTLVRLKKIKGY